MAINSNNSGGSITIIIWLGGKDNYLFPYYFITKILCPVYDSSELVTH